MTKRGRRIFDMGRTDFATSEVRVIANMVSPTPRLPLFVNLQNPISQETILELHAAMRDSWPELMRIFGQLQGAETEMRTRDVQERRKNEMTAASATKNVVQLETGEQRETNRASRVFFVYVTPTGAEMPISKCPGITKEWGRTNGVFGGDSRQTITEYHVKAPCTIKMVNLQSTFGRPKRVVNLMINIDPEAATIELKGLEGFGLFKGRAKVVYEQSTYFVNRENFKLTDTVLKEHFGLRVLQPPVKGGGAKNVRSLIFE